MLRNVKETSTELMIQNSSIEWLPESTSVLYDTVGDEDIVIENEEVLYTEDSNIEIKEVYFGDYLNQNTYIEEEADAIEEVTPSDVVVNESLKVELDQNMLVNNVVEETPIRDIIESSNVSLQTFEAADPLKLKFWDVTLPKFFLIPYNYQTEKTIDPNTIVLMDIANPEPAPVQTKSYNCDICQAACNDQLSFLKHYENEHKIFKCPFCVKHFSRRYALENHLIVHSTRKDFECLVCKTKFKRQSDLRRHEKRNHSPGEDVQSFACDTCDYQTKHKRLIRAHVLDHLGIALYSCRLCGKNFKANADLIAHQNNHVGIKPYQCDVCGNHFTRKHYMLKHRKLLHEELYSYQCDICGRAFSYKSSLVSHLRLHSGQNRVQCEVCHKVLNSKASLTNHKKMHSDANEFVCGICGKVYFNKYSLQEHVLVHTGSKPFQCLKCDKTFSMRKKLLNHEQIHSETRLRFPCSLCHKSYLSKFKLKDHARKRHSEN